MLGISPVWSITDYENHLILVLLLHSQYRWHDDLRIALTCIQSLFESYFFPCLILKLVQWLHASNSKNRSLCKAGESRFISKCSKILSVFSDLTNVVWKYCTSKYFLVLPLKVGSYCRYAAHRMWFAQKSHCILVQITFNAYAMRFEAIILYGSYFVTLELNRMGLHIHVIQFR